MFMGTKRVLLGLAFALFGFSAGAAQLPSEIASDTLDIPMDTEAAYAHYTLKKQSKLFEGYTIQIYSGDRVGANQVRASILSLGAEKEARMVYREPNFKIHVGSFPDASTAERALVEWQASFPDAFVLHTLVPWYEIKDVNDDLPLEGMKDTGSEDSPEY